MSGYKCAVHWCYEAAFKSEFPEVRASQNVITIDRQRLTAAGATAVFDLMLHLIQQELGAGIMTEVACWFQHPFVRGEEVVQKTPAPSADRTEDMLPPPVAQAIRLFAEHVEDPIQIGRVAEVVDVSARQLERSFKRSTGQSPLKYYRLLRMKKARQMALYSNDSITEIALAVGYASTTPLVRHYVQTFGLTPQQDRKAINGFRVAGDVPLPAV
jgi:transcriptional regulator GlxA family with amidase domain